MTLTNPANPLYLDGEKIPDDLFGEIFVPRPDVPRSFGRSSLIVGGKGVGKTTLLRDLKRSHPGVAVHLSLVGEFSSLAKMPHANPLALPTAREGRLVAGKAMSLLATGIFDRLVRRGIALSPSSLMECLPKKFRPLVRQMPPSAESMGLREAVASEPLDEFGNLESSDAITHVVNDLAASIGEPFLLLLDRADLVPAVALRPVFQLLDQAGKFRTLVATRPGIDADYAFEEPRIAGDDFDIVHLGSHPRSEAWLRFVTDALERAGATLSSLDDESANLLLSLSRDSVRSALELASYGRGRLENEAALGIERGAFMMRRKLLLAAQTTLRNYHPDYRQFVGDIRRETCERFGRIPGPVEMLITERPPSLFPTPSPLRRFVDAALRWGSVCTVEGDYWSPNSDLPDRVELPPLFMWMRGEGFWHPRSPETSVVSRRAADVLKRLAGGPPPKHRVYVLNGGDNSEVAVVVQQVLESFSAVRTEVTAGEPAPTLEWLSLYKREVKKSRVVVVDVNRPSLSHMIAIGLALGLGKRLILTATAEDSSSVLNLSNLYRYGSATEDYRLGLAIHTAITDPDSMIQTRLPMPVPGRVMWLDPVDERLITNFNRDLAALGLPDIESIHRGNGEADRALSWNSLRQAARASCVVAPIVDAKDVLEAGVLVGLCVARPAVGASTHALPRQLFLQTENGLAESIHWVSQIPTAALVDSDEALIKGLRGYMRTYLDWVGG